MSEPQSEAPVCVCGHSQDDHGGDPDYPGSTACRDDDCECVAYEGAEE